MDVSGSDEDEERTLSMSSSSSVSKVTAAISITATPGPTNDDDTANSSSVSLDPRYCNNSVFILLSFHTDVNFLLFSGISRTRPSDGESLDECR
jgi:hypothetical protein